MRLALGFLLGICAGPVSVWAQEFTTLKGHGGPIMGLAVSQTGQVATASFDNSVGLWNERQPDWYEGHDAAVNTVIFGPGQSLISGGDDFTIQYWENDGPPQELGAHKGKVQGLALSPDGELVASASWDGTIGLWPLSGDKPSTAQLAGRLLRGHAAGVNDVVFAGDKKSLYSASTDGTIRIWDIVTGTEVQRLVNHGFGVNRLALHPDQGWIAYGAVDGGTRVIDAATGDQIADFTLDRRPILSMAHHAETGQLAVGDGQGYIMMVDTNDWQITRDFRATRQGPVWALAFSPDGQTIYAGGLDDVAYAWPVDALDEFDPAIDGERSFLRAADTMSNGERQFMRKCSICHALDPAPSRKAGPTLHGLFGRKAGTLPDYAYSPTLLNAEIIWDETTVDALFDTGPDHYIPGSKMPMQVIRGSGDRADLIEYLKQATKLE